MKRAPIVLVLGTVVALTISFFWWVSMPISLEFVRPWGVAGDTIPFIADVAIGEGRVISCPLPGGRSGVYHIYSGQNLGWNVQVGDSTSADASIFRTFNSSGYYLLSIVTFSDGTTEFYDGGRALPGNDSLGHQTSISLGVSRGEAALFVLASRTPFNMEELRRGIEERQVRDSPVNRITNYLSSQGGGFLFFQFKVKD